MLGLLTSCGQQDDSHGEFILQNGDTLKVIKIRTSNDFKEIIIYKDNKPFQSFCIDNQADTIKLPRVLFDKSGDSIFVFIPLTDFSRKDLYFDKDSVNIILSRQIQHSVEDLHGSTVLKVLPEMLTGPKESKGCLVLKRSDGYREYYPFTARHRNRLKP